MFFSRLKTFSFEPFSPSRAGPLAEFAGEPSRRAGEEVEATEGVALGTRGNDVLWVSGSATAKAGPGRDVIFLQNRTEGGEHDGGPGADTYVLAAGPAETEIEECLIFDFGSAPLRTRAGVAGDRVELTGFAQGTAQVIDRGNGQVEVVDETGATAVFRVETPAGRGLAFEEILPRVVFAEEPPATPVSRVSRQIPFGAKDETVAGTRSFEPFLGDTTAKRVEAGGGDDDIFYRAVANGGPYRFGDRDSGLERVIGFERLAGESLTPEEPASVLVGFEGYGFADGLDVPFLG